MSRPTQLRPDEQAAIRAWAPIGMPQRDIAYLLDREIGAVQRFLRAEKIPHPTNAEANKLRLARLTRRRAAMSEIIRS